jgi:hypothetical protein
MRSVIAAVILQLLLIGYTAGKIFLIKINYFLLNNQLFYKKPEKQF